MDKANAEEFLEVYKGVVAEYTVSMTGMLKRRGLPLVFCYFSALLQIP